MRKLVFALLLLCSALFATAQEWQWSVQLKGFISSETGKEPTAFLWIPSDCHQLRAVMVGKHNMSEETLFEMPRFSGSIVPDGNRTGMDHSRNRPAMGCDKRNARDFQSDDE